MSTPQQPHPHNAIGHAGDKRADARALAKAARQQMAKKLASLTTGSELLKLVEKRAFTTDSEFQSCQRCTNPKRSDGLPYHLFLPAEMALSPEDVFPNLRWGGRAIMVSENSMLISELAQKFVRWDGFVIEKQPTAMRQPVLGMHLPWFGKPLHYFVARKVDLLKPGESTDRFTYQVRLTKRAATDSDYVVVKQVPTVDRVISRLRAKFPDAPLDDIRRRAMKFTEKIFPVFLTREAAMLQILERDLPAPYNERVPRCLGVEHDSKGFVRVMYMNWLRNGGDGISQLDFAIQATELLSALHDKVGVIHLDLRLDNFVITEKGVGFIDFGSAVRVGEKFADNSLLSTLFEEMMRTSQIQRMLYHMTETGLVTSDVLRSGVHRMDKAVDMFYLAVQMNKPHSNPDFKGLVHMNPKSLEAQHIKRLSDEILRPVDASAIPYRNAKEILAGLHKVRDDVLSGREVDACGRTAVSFRDDPAESHPAPAASQRTVIA